MSESESSDEDNVVFKTGASTKHTEEDDQLAAKILIDRKNNGNDQDSTNADPSEETNLTDLQQKISKENIMAKTVSDASDKPSQA